VARKKHIKIKQVRSFKNVFSFGSTGLYESIKEFFDGVDKFTLELGCGHGDYSVELALMNQNRYFIGVDIKASRIFNGAVRAIDLNLTNAAFLISRAEKLAEIFPENSIEEIYIPFPDPHIKRKSAPRRLVSKKFLETYRLLLIENGKVHLKTDNEMIFNYTLKTINEVGCRILNSTDDLYAKGIEKINNEIKTKYEQHYLDEGRKIKYICFGF
jgi:tRNA (guanine-N7-)-methyltransferase